MKEKTIIILCSMLCVTLIVWGIFFWPTLYRYDKTEGKLVRINKITGYTEILYDSGWVPSVEKKIRVMPQDEKNKVEVIGRLDLFEAKEKPVTGGRFLYSGYKGTIYNGTSWTIRKVRLSIAAKNKTGKDEWQKIYETSVDIPPFSWSSCSIRLMDPPFIIPETKVDSSEAPKEKEQANKQKMPEAVELSPDVKILEIFGYEGE